MRRCDAATGLAGAFGTRGRSGYRLRQTAAKLTERQRLCRHLLPGLRWLYRRGCGTIRQLQNLPRAQTVDVLLLKSLRIAALQADQHLLQRNALDGVLLRHTPQGITRLDQVRTLGWSHLRG